MFLVRPTRDGQWYCEKCERNIPSQSSTHHHLMRPDLVPYATAVEATDDWIKYESEHGVFFNSNLNEPYHYTSQEMRNYEGALPLDKVAEEIRSKFGAKVAGDD